MATTKKPITLTRAKLNKIKEEVSGKILMLFLATAMDEFEWSDEDVERFGARLGRYSEAMNTHLLSVAKFKTIIEESMGISLSWLKEPYDAGN